jgi:glycosyltransferase involved in cell wall biosynthesis
MNLYVVIPIYNEEAFLGDTLIALARQSDKEFVLVLVNNNSTDNTRQLIENFVAAHPDMRIIPIEEAQKGTGAASDTGFRHAIVQGASHIARTDADCLPHVDWIRNIKRAFIEHQLEFIGGVILPREDEPISIKDRLLIPLLLWLADVTGAMRRRGRDKLYPYFMAAGNNLAITAELYEKAGGFPRTKIEEVHEDRELSEKVRCLTAHGARVENVIVYNSLRRLRDYGYRNTLKWYWNHLYQPKIVDVR